MTKSSSPFSRIHWVHSRFGERLRHPLTYIGWWRRSLVARVVSAISVATVIAMVIAGFLIVSQIRSQLFDKSVTSFVDQFDSTRSNAQASFDAATALTAGNMQQIANSVVSELNDPALSIVGATIIRTEGAKEASFHIVEPFTEADTPIRSLISSKLRAEVPRSNLVHWQSVALKGSDGKTIPGIVVGAPITIPGAGEYELYVAYTLESQEESMQMITSTLIIGSLVLIALLALVAWIVVGFVLRPVQEASRSARVLAEGDFDTRLKVRGEDELATLARSFNTMARSISEQFTRLERLSKVQQEFVSAVSHELRTPVTTIRMAGQLIYDKRDELPPALKRSAELQHNQLINLDTTLSDLLEISRFDAGAMALTTTVADLGEIVDSCIHASAILAASNRVEVLTCVQGDTRASMEPRRVERIIRNLLVNALEHAKERDVRVRVIGGESAVAVEVSDHGIGLTSEQSKHVFDRFWRADTSRVRKTGGTGLGLTIAREDALLHGGSLTCQGELDVGATFLLVLPRTANSPYTAPLPERIAAREEDWDSPIEPLDVPIKERLNDPADHEAVSEREKESSDDVDRAHEVNDSSLKNSTDDEDTAALPAHSIDMQEEGDWAQHEEEIGKREADDEA